MNDKTYDVNQYTDIELYNILELVNPSDRVLEAKIIQLIHKYDAINNESGKKLTQFFKDIYNHFFYDSDDEDYKTIKNEGFQEGMNEPTQPPQQQTQQQTPQQPPQQQQQQPPQQQPPQQQPQQQPQQTPPQQNPLSTGNYSTIAPVNTLEYTKDYINPLLKQTIKRTISIDSQYRDKKYSISTDFTFNLSEPLRDVVALRLYSVQIPYAWYTINRDYGGNYFYLKGISPGIDNGSFDYQIDISSGNYSPNELVTTINNSITKTKTRNPEVNFGSTQLSYNGGTNLFSFNIEIENVFNETNYEITFLNPSSKNQYPLSTDQSNNQLIYIPSYTSMVSAFLGFNYTSYSPKTIYSKRNIPSTTITTNTDNRDPSYFLDSSNNYFIIYQYRGPEPLTNYDPQNTKVTFHTTIQLSLTGSQTRTTIFNELNTQLKNNPYLINSSIYRTDISGNYIDPTTNYNYIIDNNGNSFYGLTIELNKKTTPSYPNAKTVIVFPSEEDTQSRIWVKDPNINYCCFNFHSITNEVNTINAETPIKESTFLIDKNPYIIFKCIAPGYKTQQEYTNINIMDISYTINISNNTNIIDISNTNNIWNDYIVKVKNSDTLIGYDLSGYINAINTGINETNDLSKKGSNQSRGVFNMDEMGLINNIDISNNLIFRFDVNKRFTTDLYSLDLSNTILYKLFGLGATTLTNLGTDDNPIIVYESNIGSSLNNSNIDLSGNNQITSRITSLDSYNLKDLSSSSIITIFPNNRGTNNNLLGNISNNNLTVENANQWNIPFIGNKTTSYGLRQLIEIINLSFNEFKDGDSYPLIGSEITYTQLADSTIRLKLTININKILTENDYKLIFYDPSGNYDASGIYIKNGSYNPKGSWNKYLNLDSSYNLVDFSNNETSYTDITISNVQLTNFYLQEDVKIMIKPILTSYNGLNNNIEPIYITIPATSSFYTIGQIKSFINDQFNSSENKILNGSYLDYTKDDENNYYVSIRMNINNVYTANDYKLVFYDLNSFVKCYVGSSSVRNVSWDSTLGWILGFREEMEYYLNMYTDSTLKIASLTADTVYSSNLYNYFLIVLDDYTQSHLNDGLVTLTQKEELLTIPTYAPKSSLQCDTDENAIFTGTISKLSGQNLTQNQIYSANEIYKARKNKIKNFSLGPYIQDIFGFVPIKVSGLSNGSSYIEFGGTLQNQNRIYFGPVNIHRMTIKLINDKGNTVDLNGCNWSFSFECEQLYQQKTL